MADTLRAAHAAACAMLRTEPCYADPTRPSSLDVMAQLHRAGVRARQPDVRTACAALGLVLADARSEDPPRPARDEGD
jgi:hypothetical protein